MEIGRSGEVRSVTAASEVIVSAGAINTAKLFMLPGLGARAALPAIASRCFSTFPAAGGTSRITWPFAAICEHHCPLAPRNSGSEATLYWKTRPELEVPDLLFCQVNFPVPSERTAALGVPEHGWTMFGGLARPQSRGEVRLASSDPHAAPFVDAEPCS